MDIEFNKWLKSKNFNSNVETILRQIDKSLNTAAEDTRRGKTRISFGIDNSESFVILIWRANSIRLQVKAKYYLNYSAFGFVTPRIKEHGEKGFMELIITDSAELTEKLKKFLINGLH